MHLIIGVKVKPGETDDGNHFVDSDNGSITGGSVKDDDAKPRSGATRIILSDKTGTVIATPVTDSTGLVQDCRQLHSCDSCDSRADSRAQRV